MKRHLFSCVLAVVLSVGGCSLAVGPGSPRPNVMIAADKTPSTLVLGNDVRDAYSIPGHGSMKEVDVRGWRGTLERGFQSGFPGGNSGRKLELIAAELSFSPAAVSGTAGTSAVFAAIRFKARLLDASGAEVGVLAGTASSGEANASPSEEGMTDSASKAVSAMYEQLSTELLSK